MQQTDEQMRWTRIASFADAGSAHVARLQLDAEDIPTYLDNENTAMMLWHIQPAVGGVRLCVPERCADQARSILHQASREEEQAKGDDEGLDDASSHLAYASLHRCPKCHSTETEELTWRRRIVQTVVVLVLGMFLVGHPVGMALVVGYAIYFLATKPERCCDRCRHRWTPQQTG
jgi:hypothetical protein